MLDPVLLIHRLAFRVHRWRVPRVPVIAAGAYLGAGARVLGPVTVGENAVVGANAVVLEDVPANCIVVGIPARVVKTDIPPGAFR